jgi:tetratricopeptide (TPR) repeat protein
VSALLLGFLGGALVTNSPQAASNQVPYKPGVALPATTFVANDPAEDEFHRIMLDDDKAEKEILGWMDTSDAFAKAGGDSKITLNSKIQQRLDGIKKEYEDFIERHPKHVNIRLAFGSFLRDVHDDQGAFTQWDTARQLDPTNPAAWDNLGNYYAYSTNGPVKKAFECYDKAIELNSTQSIYYHNLAATIYLFRKEAQEYYHLNESQAFDKALNLYQQAIKLDPDNFVLLTDYAESFYGTNPPRWKDGLAAWTEALKIAHDDGEKEGVYVHLARLHLKLGALDEAKSDLAAITNANYAELKTRLTSNLNAALAKAKTNSPPPATTSGK